MYKEKSYKIVTEQRAKFTVITKDKKIYHWEFPATSSLGENYDVLNNLLEEVWNTIEKQRKETKETKESAKKETKDGKPVEELTEEQYKNALKNAEIIES